MLLDIGFVLILVICIIIGIKQGFVKSAFGIISLFASMFAAVYLYKPFINMLYGIPMVSGIIDSMIESIQKLVFSVLSGSDTATLPPIFSAVISSDVAAQGIETVAHAIAEMVFSCILIVVFIVLIRIGITLVSKTLNLFTKLPVIKSFNGLLGGVSGFISGILTCYIAAVILFILSGYANGAWVNENLTGSVFAKTFFENNIIISLLFGN